jgi:hypothetical protein
MPPRGRGGRGRGRGVPTPEDPPANLDLATTLAEMQTMRAQMNALRQAPASGALGGAPSNALAANPGGSPIVPPERLLDLRDSCRMH